ncbi:MFS transporter [Denitrobaculum tricleocarpae]|uniref:MFS transporter n=1 Tax=Denitrobaculum tricleocarpae TaxID=2591009 RepID=A0A545U341_9PROT|nr:MFS transporter [Denitrobaculum tricleocarpae]TQV83833.1 MFS transporter [Denitrobaculum tricleocarpae]
MNVIDRLTQAAYGLHIADQIALVAVPLVAALVFQASPETIGVLVACQAMAHLLGSIPSGIIVDRLQPRSVAIAATAISLTGFLGVTVSVTLANLPLFAITILLSGCGIVLFVLVALSIIPKVVKAENLAPANARIEIPRAVASFAVPLAIGLLVDGEAARLVFGGAALCAFGALAVTLKLPRLPEAPQKREKLLKMVLEGGALVVRHPLLRPIAACAIFWNLAFAALLVAMVPLILDHYRADPGVFGIALSAFGGAAIIGSWLSSRFSHRISPNIILLFGPGSSVLAILALLAIPPNGPVEAIYASFFLLGFGPSMWLIVQNSIRQLVTPAQMLGRVNAVIQTAIYGVRPLGALAGGAIVGAASPGAGILFVVLAFGCSLAAALFSQLRAVRSYGALQIEVTRQ